MQQENLIGGFLYAFLSLSMFFPNLLVLTTILRFTEYSSITYLIIKNMCFACLIHLCLFLLGAIMTFANSNFNEILEKIAGAAVQSAWMLHLTLSLALAVNRMLTFVWTHLRIKFSYIFMIFAWIHALIHFILFLLPGFGFVYCHRGKCFSWYYDPQPGSTMMDVGEPFALLAIVSSVLVCYLVVLLCVFKMRTKSASHNMPSFRVEI